MNKKNVRITSKEHSNFLKYIEYGFIFIIIMIVGSLILNSIIKGIGTGLELTSNKAEDYTYEDRTIQEKIDEYALLENQFNEINHGINDIEEKHAELGYIEYNKLTELELKRYLELFNSRISISRQMGMWYVNNADLLKNKKLIQENVETDLQIQQKISDYKELREDDEERVLNIYNVIQLRSLLEKESLSEDSPISASLNIDKVQIQASILYPIRLTIINNGDLKFTPKFDIYVYEQNGNEICSGTPMADEFNDIQQGEEKIGEIIILGCTFKKDGTYRLQVDLLDSNYNLIDSKNKDFIVNYWAQFS